MVWRCARVILNVACWSVLPLLAVAQDPGKPAPAPNPPNVPSEAPAVETPAPDTPKVNEPGTADTTPPDPTIINAAPAHLFDDPGEASYRRAEPVAPPAFAYEVPDPVRMPFIDRAHLGLWNTVWHSAMRMDSMFAGSSANEAVYQQTSGSLAPSVLWDKHDGFKQRVRFDVDVPLPHLNERLHAFVGRVNRDEFVTERQQNTGPIARQFGPAEEDETIFGIRYREPRQGGHFQADAGLRIRSPLDPFVKGSYNFMKGSSESTLFTARETVFWQNSEKFGLTSRVDIERVFQDTWLLRWTASATVSQKTEGGRGYTALNLMRGLPHRRAIAAELFTTGEFNAPVPTEDYGLKIAYRRSVARDWLVLETRISCTFPRDELTQNREATLGIGVGLEMFFGTNEFLARPVTF
jgi:hypothetical protein